MMFHHVEARIHSEQRGTQSPKGYFLEAREQPEEGSLLATIHRVYCAQYTLCMVRRSRASQSRESARARAMACVRFSAPSLLKMLATCFLAVASETTR